MKGGHKLITKLSVLFQPALCQDGPFVFLLLVESTPILFLSSPRVISSFGNVDAIFAILIGGAGNLYGAVIGGTIFMLIKNFLPLAIPEVSNAIGVELPHWEMWLGIILLVIVFSVRQGVVGVIRSKWQGRRLPGEAS